MLENILHANNIGSLQKRSTLPPCGRCGGGMDVFWNDPFQKIMHANNIPENPASWADLD